MGQNNVRALSAVLVAFLAGIAGAQYIETTINVGRSPVAAVYDSIDAKVFIANKTSGTVSVINPATNTVTATIPVGVNPVALCWVAASDRLYVACAPVTGNGSVYVINAADNSVVTTVTVRVNPAAMAWCTSRSKLYVLNASANGPITIINSSNQVTKNLSIPDGHTPNDIVYNPTSDRIYVSSAAMASTGKVRVVNPSNDNISTSVTCGNSAWELGVNPTTNRVYCSNRSSNTVSVINCATSQRLANVSVTGEPHPVYWTPANKVFIGEYWNQTVAYMHGESLRVKGRFSVPGSPGSIFYVPAMQRLFVADYLSGKVSVCDPRDGHEGVIVDLEVGSGPLGFAYYPNAGRLYVTNSWDSTVAVIVDDTPIEEPGPVQTLGEEPRASAWPNPAPAGAAVRFQTSGFAPKRLEVRDASGRLVLARPLLSLSFPLPTSALPPGVYFCHLTDGLRSADCRLTVR
jgi:YVTN family beta-propeller protein